MSETHLGGMIVARVEAKQLLPRDGVTVIELVRADDVALGAEAEELALDGVEVELGVDRLGEDRVERLGQPLPRALAVDGRVFHAVGNPDVGDAGRPERLAEGGPDLPAGDPVVDPELADGRIGVGQRVAVGRQGWAK